MDVVNVILQPVVESLMVPVKKHIGYMTSCKKYVRDMDTSMTELKATRIDVEKHMKLNKGSNLEIPAHVPGWLEEVEKVDAKVKSISSDIGNCFSFKTRHEIGSKAFNMIQDIKLLTEEHSRIVWTDHRLPLGKVDSMRASTSASSVEYHSDFESREQTFMKALKALEAAQKSHMIALCGMGGVGKTTMMEKLKTVVKEKGMFSLIVEAVIGEKTTPFAIQDAVADYLAIDLKEKSVSARAVKLRDWFKNYSEGGKKKILVILDDIWQLVDLNDIGLSPLPDQGVDFKVLLTSRSRDVCTTMGVEANSIFHVNVLANAEAQSFFWQFIKDSGEADLDPDFRKVGDDIVSRCQGLPIAIKTIAYTLKGRSKGVWEDTLTRLHYHDIDKNLSEIFELSYKNLEDEQTKSVLLLCGLYPEDFDIPTEELVRYGWGLKLFNKVYTMGQARNRVNACIEQLLNTNLLIESNHGGCIKMHDLVLAFVLKKYSEVEHASIVNHGNMSEWPENDTPDSCKRISFTCKGMEEFPRDFEYPNLSFLKLTHAGYESLRFPENFYRLMEKLQVIVYEKLQYPPLLPRSLENLRTLCLHECSSKFDCDSIGSLLKLEVLSFANCGIRKLPSTIGNLKELKLLDLTGCVNLRIDEGILKNLVKLEELYMRVADKEGISLTDGNFNELAERSKTLSAIEIELFRNNAHRKRISFNNLERFKISIGRLLEWYNQKTTSFENTLMLVSNKRELLEYSGINMLFEKTVVFHLEVDDLEELKYSSSFYKLRVLKISKCAQLRYLFTSRVAATLLKLEHLEVSSCDVMQTLVHDDDDDEDSGSEPIKFPSLKLLSLDGLPKLAGLCNTGSVIELPHLMKLLLDGLPNFTSIFADDNSASSSSSMSSDTSTMQPFFNEGVAIPMLETLQIRSMKKLNKIRSSEAASSDDVCFSMLKTIKVEECDRLVNLFPRNPMPLLHHLKELYVRSCGSIKIIFEIDMGCVSETGEGSSSSLVSIDVRRSKNVRHVWSLKNVDDDRIIRGFEAVESIQIDDCESFRNVVTPITANFNLKALQQVDIDHGFPGKQVQRNNNAGISRGDIAFSSHLIHTFHQLRKLTLKGDTEAQVVFDIESGKLMSTNSQNNHPRLLPSLEYLTFIGMKSMSHVWKCNWNQFFILQQPKSLCHNLTNIYIRDCRSIKYLFSPLMFKFLSNLKHVEIHECEAMEEIVTNRDDAEMATNLTFPPILEKLELRRLRSLQHIGGSCTSIYNQFQVPYPSLDASTSLPVSERIPWFYNNLIKVVVRFRRDRRYIIRHNELQHMLKVEKFEISKCSNVREIFETSEMNNGLNQTHSVVEVREMDFKQLYGIKCLWKSKQWTVLKFPNLTRLSIHGCDGLKHVFTISMVGSLLQLQELHIRSCPKMEIIVEDVQKEEEEQDDDDGKEEEEEEDERRVNKVEFPCLRSLTLRDLKSLKGFRLGMEAIHWPSLDTLQIEYCPKITTFANGESTTPKLKLIKTSFGLCDATEGVNSFIRTKIEEGMYF